jgi:hypothetical protein
MNLVTELKISYDFSKIKDEINLLLANHNYPSQLCLQGKTSNYTDWQYGTGSIKENERLFKDIHESIIDYELSKLIKFFNAVRSRIMILNKKSCYSVHSDNAKRIHLPIVTNDQCWMIWPYLGICEQLLEGKIYLTDTTKKHTFFNGADEQRIHLVMSLYTTQTFK